MSSTTPHPHPRPPTNLLDPSPLGTKEYWDAHYARSLRRGHRSTLQQATSDTEETVTGTATVNDSVTNGHSLKEVRNGHGDSTKIASREEELGNEGNVEGSDVMDSDDDDDDNDISEQGSGEDSDPGTTWFADSRAEQKILSFLNFPLPQTSPHSSSSTHSSSSAAAAAPPPFFPLPKDSTIMDLGTGNGGLLFRLRDEGGFEGGKMVGVDYSEGSVNLARGLQVERWGKRERRWERRRKRREGRRSDGQSAIQNGSQSGRDAEGKMKKDEIRFEVFDFMTRDPPPLLPSHSASASTEASCSGQVVKSPFSWFPWESGGFDLVLDKGTFDAISLSEERDPATGQRICGLYAGRVERLVRKGGLLLVTSCNWTEEELKAWIVGGKSDAGEGEGRFEVVARIEYKKFTFGGQQGQTVCSVCFRRR
ncbi:hypothetical protein MMC25_000758 [Agyrium rufum]|nr:hypothetical protein [Agyrium rufum]